MNFFNRSCRIVLQVALLFAMAPSSHAEFRYGPLSLRGFGTLGLVWSSNEDADYAPNNRPTGPGFSRTIDIKLDSRVGGQASVTLGETTLITAQAVAEYNPDGTYTPRLTLGNIRQEFLDHFAVRAGRTQNPVFLASEYRVVNFPNPWVRPPVVVYSIFPLVHQDGADITYFTDTQLGRASLQVGYGWLDFKTPSRLNQPPDSLELDDIVFVNSQLEEGPWRFKFSWVYSSLTYPNTGLKEGLSRLASFDRVAAEQMAIQDRDTFVYALGATYDSSDWLVMAEWSLRRSHSALIDRQGGYLTVAHRFDRFMPQVTLGYQGTGGPSVESSDPRARAIIHGINDSQRSDHFFASVGLNYDLFDFAVIRAQLDFINPTDGSFGPYRNHQIPGYDRANPDSYYLLSITMDVVF